MRRKCFVARIVQDCGSPALEIQTPTDRPVIGRSRRGGPACGPTVLSSAEGETEWDALVALQRKLRGTTNRSMFELVVQALKRQPDVLAFDEEGVLIP